VVELEFFQIFLPYSFRLIGPQTKQGCMHPCTAEIGLILHYKSPSSLVPYKVLYNEYSVNGLQIRSGTDSVLSINVRTVYVNDKLFKNQILTLSVIHLFKDSVREFLSRQFFLITLFFNPETISKLLKLKILNAS
jgi:hypothetical protein